MATAELETAQITPSTGDTPAANATISIEGMRCASCVSQVEQELSHSPGVRQTAVNLATEQATVSYEPSAAAIEHGTPARLTFRREETAACSEKVLLPDFHKSAELPEGELVPVEFTPEQLGEYEFACGMGMLHGKVIAR